MATIPKDTYLPETQPQKSATSVLILTANNTEDLEFFYPFYRFTEEGFNVDVVTPDGGAFKGKNGLGISQTKKITDVNAADYQLLYIPGGKAPAELKENSDAIALTKAFYKTGRPIAAVCHGPQVLAAAGVITGKNIAAWPEVEDEVEEAGANYMDQQTCVDGQFITARWPADLPFHLAKTLEVLKNSKTIKKAA
jgi:protease I